MIRGHLLDFLISASVVKVIDSTKEMNIPHDILGAVLGRAAASITASAIANGVDANELIQAFEVAFEHDVATLTKLILEDKKCQ